MDSFFVSFIFYEQPYFTHFLPEDKKETRIALMSNSSV